MPTLQEIKKEQGLTNADIARALQCSVSKVSTLLQGRHIKAISDEEIDQLAKALSNYHVVTFERCWLAMQESYNVWSGKPQGMLHERAAELQYRIAPSVFVVPRSTSIEGALVVDETRMIESGNE